MQYFAYDSLAIAAVVLLALVVTANACFALYQNVQKARKPGRDVESMLDNDNRRISKLEADAEENKKATRLILKSQMQLLQHGINGNHVEQMQKTYDEIQEYVIGH